VTKSTDGRGKTLQEVDWSGIEIQSTLKKVETRNEGWNYEKDVRSNVRTSSLLWTVGHAGGLDVPGVLRTRERNTNTSWNVLSPLLWGKYRQRSEHVIHPKKQGRSCRVYGLGERYLFAKGYN